jgi:hypothetical protein
MRKAANKAPIEVCETQENLDITVAGRFWLLGNRPNPVPLHLNAFRRDNEADKS